LALVRLYALDSNEAWLGIAEKGADYLINIRDKEIPTERLLHDHWLLYALNELYRYRPKNDYLNHALRIVESILKKQNRNPEYQDYLGSYYRPPRSAPTATRSEGLAAAYGLVRDFVEDPDRIKAIEEAIRLGVVFQIKLQYLPETSMYMEDPQRCLGAIRGSYTNFETRIDYSQHTISSLIGYYLILRSYNE